MGGFPEKRFLKPRRVDPSKREELVSAFREELSRRPEILFAYLHGSFVKGEEFRDIDVAVYLAAPQDLAYELDLSHALRRRAGMEVDLKAIQDAPLAFQMAVLRDGLLLFSRDEEVRTDFIERTSRRYPEYAHFRNVFLGIDGVRRQ